MIISIRENGNLVREYVVAPVAVDPIFLCDDRPACSCSGAHDVLCELEP